MKVGKKLIDFFDEGLLWKAQIDKMNRERRKEFISSWRFPLIIVGLPFLFVLWVIITIKEKQDMSLPNN